MVFLRQLGSFWLTILALGAVGYFCAYNLEYINVTIPHIAELRIRAAVIYILLFLIGCSFTVVYFGVGAIKKSFKIRNQSKRLGQLEKQIQKLGKTNDQNLSQEESCDQDKKTNI